jgi:hypothetical protein
MWRSGIHRCCGGSADRLPSFITPSPDDARRSPSAEPPLRRTGPRLGREESRSYGKERAATMMRMRRRLLVGVLAVAMPLIFAGTSFASYWFFQSRWVS